MKTFIILFLVLSLYAGKPHSTASKPEYFPRHQKTAKYLQSLNYRWLTDKTKLRYFKVISKEARKNNLDPYWVARQINTESHFRWWASSGIADGAMAIRPEIWGHLLYRNAELKPFLKSNNHRKFLKRIGYNIEVGSQVMRYYLDLSDNDYPLALIGYWAGENSWQYKLAKSDNAYKYTNKYVKSIISDNI